MLQVVVLSSVQRLIDCLTVSPLGALMCHYSETSLDIKTEKNHLLWQHYCMELNALSKR